MYVTGLFVAYAYDNHRLIYKVVLIIVEVIIKLILMLDINIIVY